jgi:hypothetical protein
MINKYFRIQTPEGERTAKCTQYMFDGKPYGIYSLTEYLTHGDAQGIVIPEGAPEATEQQAEAWEAWYNG